MLTFELVSKKRKPIKRYAFSGIIVAILLLVLTAFVGQYVDSAAKVTLIIVFICTFIICLYIINYSVGFKNTIGQITFFENYIEIELNGNKEIININNIRNLRFKLNGYEGLNKSTMFDYVVLWLPSFFSYHNGMNNFVNIYSSGGARQFEFYIPDKKSWLEVKKIGQPNPDDSSI
jgi:hypothetical protein